MRLSFLREALLRRNAKIRKLKVSSLRDFRDTAFVITITVIPMTFSGAGMTNMGKRQGWIPASAGIDDRAINTHNEAMV